MMYDGRMSDVPKVARRLTVNLITDANDALTEISTGTGHNHTDTVNRALQLAAFIHRETRAGGTLMIREASGDLRAVTIL